jgi:hypothetical protein
MKSGNLKTYFLKSLNPVKYLSILSPIFAKLELNYLNSQENDIPRKHYTSNLTPIEYNIISQYLPEMPAKHLVKALFVFRRKSVKNSDTGCLTGIDGNKKIKCIKNFL